VQTAALGIVGSSVLPQVAQGQPQEISAGETITETIDNVDDQDEFELLVNQGDVVEINFEKGLRNLTELSADAPSDVNSSSIYLGGYNSAGEERLTGRTTIEETGTLDITVGTVDSETTGQEYRFVVNGTLQEENGTLPVSISPTSVTANTATDVTISVLNEAGDPVEGATVEISDLNLSATTDATGEATLTVDTDNPADYEVVAAAEGYTNATTTLTVKAGTTGDHESGVSQELFDADDQDGDDVLSRDETRGVVEQFIRTGEIDGVPIARDDVRSLVKYLIRQ